MTSLFVLFVAAFLLPLIFHSWRVAVIGLGVQGFLLGLILLSTHEFSLTMIVEAVNLFAVRAVAVPWILFRSMGQVRLDESYTLIKNSFLQWALALIIILIGSIFGHSMAPDDSSEAFQVGTAAIAILSGLLILANQRHVFGQVVGIITFESGLTLVELLSDHVVSLEVYAGISLVFGLLVLTLADYIHKFKIRSSDAGLLEDGIVL